MIDLKQKIDIKQSINDQLILDQLKLEHSKSKILKKIDFYKSDTIKLNEAILSHKSHIQDQKSQFQNL